MLCEEHIQHTLAHVYARGARTAMHPPTNTLFFTPTNPLTLSLLHTPSCLSAECASIHDTVCIRHKITHTRARIHPPTHIHTHTHIHVHTPHTHTHTRTRARTHNTHTHQAA